jgi:ankyrin repeat protein
MAARSGSKEVVEMLLANKAKVNIKDNDGVTARERATMQGHKGVAELLRLHGGHE